MEEISALAAAEAITILNNTDISLITKIPYIILKALEDKAKEYTEEIKIDINLQLTEQKISDEAQAILAIIYKDYWCDKEKKQEMNRLIQDKTKEYEKQQVERLNPFKDSNYEKVENKFSKGIEIGEEDSETKSLIELPRKWYIRIFDRIIRFFRKK